MILPMEDIRILDLTTQLPGPYCSMLLADLGAEVIKIERPGSGDPARYFPKYFQSVNRNKKSCTLNLRGDAGREILLKMAADADVVMEGFRPGVVARLGVDYEAVKKVNEKAIYCSITSFGQDGPYRDVPGYDINCQGVAGLLRAARPKTMQPREADVWIGDMSSGMFAALSILATLLARYKTGRGQYIDLSMMEGLLSWAGPHAGFEVQEGHEEPGYGVFETADGRYISLGVSYGEPFWDKMWSALGYEKSPKASMGELKKIVAGKLKEKSAARWLEIFHSADVPCGPIYYPEEAADDPQVAHRKVLVETEHPEWGKYMHARFPALFSETSTQIRSGAPTLGEHTHEIIAALGYSAEEMENLRTSGTI